MLVEHKNKANMIN